MPVGSAGIPQGYEWRTPKTRAHIYPLHQMTSLCGRSVYAGDADECQTLVDAPLEDDCALCWRAIRAIAARVERDAGRLDADDSGPVRCRFTRGRP